MAGGLTVSSQAAEYGPTDHLGADFSVAEGDVLWGEHRNVGRFTVPAGIVAHVKPVDRETSTSPRLYGWVEVQAVVVEVSGTLDASGAGCTGGGGGAFAHTNNPGHGDYPDDDGGMFDGAVSNTGYGGVGGPGDSIPVVDWSPDSMEVEIGSGGHGDTGGHWVYYEWPPPTPDPTPHGGGGGRGGGAIRLLASERIHLTGSILTHGLWGQMGGPGGGGNSSPPSDTPNGAEGGSGGGILLVAPKVAIVEGATISSTGPDADSSIGGELKIFADEFTRAYASDCSIQAKSFRFSRLPRASSR